MTPLHDESVLARTASSDAWAKEEWPESPSIKRSASWVNRWSFAGLMRVILLLSAFPSILAAQGVAPAPLTVSVDPPWPDIRVELVGFDQWGVTNDSGKVVLRVRASFVEVRGTTPFGETVSEFVEIDRWSNEILLEFPGLRSAGGILRVSAMPGSRVAIQGMTEKVVSPDGSILVAGLPPGSQPVSIIDPSGLNRIRRTVTIRAGERTELSVPVSALMPPSAEDPPSSESMDPVVLLPLDEIASTTAVLQLSADIPTDVKLRGALLGTAVPGEDLSIRLSEGVSELSLVSDGGHSGVVTADLAAGTVVSRRVEWKEAPADQRRGLMWALRSLAIFFLSSSAAAFAGIGFLQLRSSRQEADGRTPLTADSPPAPSFSRVGSTFDRFLIRRYLGHGGMASVYEAADPEHGLSALKILTQRGADDHELQRRFLREASLLKEIGTRFPEAPIVRLLDYGREKGAPDGRPFIELELIDGVPLQRLVEIQGAAKPELLIHVLQEVLKALHAAHSCGVFHRDLTPDNIMVTDPRSTTPGIRVIDFGVAKHSLTTSHTVDGAVFGKPAYMAPEIWEGKEVTAQTDLYSLGMIAYLLACGSPPFDDQNPVKVMRQHLMAERPPFPASLPEPLRDALSRLAMRDPIDRPESALVMLEVLGGIGKISDLNESSKNESSEGGE